MLPHTYSCVSKLILGMYSSLITSIVGFFNAEEMRLWI